MAVVFWVSQSGGATGNRVCLLIRMPGRLELAAGWNHTPKRIPGLKNTLVVVGSRWPIDMLADKIRELTPSSDWREQSIGPRGSGIFYIVLQEKNILTNLSADPRTSHLWLGYRWLMSRVWLLAHALVHKLWWPEYCISCLFSFVFILTICTPPSCSRGLVPFPPTIIASSAAV